MSMREPPNVKSSATATGGKAGSGTMITKFHLLVETEGAVAVGCSDLLGIRKLFIIGLKHHVSNLLALANNHNPNNRLNTGSDCR